jgi:hypothetical protein
MLTPAQCIADLDEMLADRPGNTITLRRKIGAAYVTVDCVAVENNVSDPQLAGNISQDAYTVIMSPTPLASWAVTPNLPNSNLGDQALVQGRWRTIEAVNIKMMGDIPVRIELRAVG